MTETPRWGAGAVRRARPLVHCVTSPVAAKLSADALLALGAAPVLALDPAGAREVAAAADGLCVNIGMWDAMRAEGVDAALSARMGCGWVLDPVGAAGSAARLARSRALAARAPSVIRGNVAEICALAGLPHGGRGVDAGATGLSAAVIEPLKAYAGSVGTVLAVTGETDQVISKDEMAVVQGGHPLMARVSAMGCALSAAVAAWLGAGAPPAEAAKGALTAFAEAGAAAGASAAGPGSFAPLFLDALHALAAPS